MSPAISSVSTSALRSSSKTVSPPRGTGVRSLFAKKRQHSYRGGQALVTVHSKRRTTVLKTVASVTTGESRVGLVGLLRNLLAPSSESADMSDPVAVIGASGRLGQLIVKSLTEQGRNVIATTRRESIEGLELDKKSGKGNVQVRSNVDVRDIESLKRGLAGARQVIIASGPTRDRDAGTPEDIDYLGTAAVTRVLTDLLSDTREPDETVVKHLNASDLAFERLDDVIMGGQSESRTEMIGQKDEEETGDGVGASNGAMRWSGQLIVEGGGFCGTRVKFPDPISLNGVDCVRLTIRSSQNLRFKMNVKTLSMAETPEYTFQAPFSVPQTGDQFVTIDIPRQAFVSVKRASVTYDNSPALLQTESVAQIGFVYSRFEFNGGANPQYMEGDFALDVKSIEFVRKARPDIVMVSSAGVERNLLLSDVERRSALPIIVLNPGGLLNYKYLGEQAIREASAADGLRYCIIRPTGLVQDLNDQPPGGSGASSDQSASPNDQAEAAPPPPVFAKLLLSQGDRIQGRITRSVVAQVVSAALSTSASVNTTFEATESFSKNMNKDGKVESITTVSDIERELAALCQDIDRPSRGMLPMPAGVEPEKPEEDK